MKIKGDYAIIETGEEAAVFPPYILDEFLLIDNDVEEVAVHHTAVAGALRPIKGDAVFQWVEPKPKRQNPGYHFNYSKPFSSSGSVVVVANALTIGKTVGELRALLTWANSDKGE
jgi:hypothetical protein